MTASKPYWYLENLKVYNYQMTMVAVLIANDGMAFIGDGRVNSLDEKVIYDDQVKLFELSPLSVILPCNGAADNIENIMAILKNTLKTTNVINVDDVTRAFQMYCKKYVEIDNKNMAPLFTIAGYNLLPTGVYLPKIYVLKYEENEWKTYESKTNDTFVANGASVELVREYLSNEYVKADAILSSRNKLALNSLKIAEVDSPQYVGGKTSLWNLIPGKPLTKMTDKEIQKLKDKI